MSLARFSLKAFAPHRRTIVQEYKIKKNMRMQARVFVYIVHIYTVLNRSFGRSDRSLCHSTGVKNEKEEEDEHMQH